MKPCECSETSVLRALGLRLPLSHSCEYVRSRNVLAATAFRYAETAASGIKVKGERLEAESRFFQVEMTRLVADAWHTGAL